MAKAILFDLDGTLIDSAPDLTVVVDRVLRNLGYAPAGLNKVRSWIGEGAQQLLIQALADARSVSLEQISTTDTASIMARFQGLYRVNCCVQSHLYQGVLDTLAVLAGKSYRMAIVTNKPFEFAQQIVNFYGLDQFCPVLIGGDSCNTKKPAPDMLYAAAEQLGVRINCCVMVGDSKSDVLAAKAAGINCYAVGYGYHQGYNLQGLGAAHVVAEFSQLRGFL